MQTTTHSELVEGMIGEVDKGGMMLCRQPKHSLYRLKRRWEKREK